MHTCDTDHCNGFAVSNRKSIFFIFQKNGAILSDFLRNGIAGVKKFSKLCNGIFCCQLINRFSTSDFLFYIAIFVQFYKSQITSLTVCS